jgi:hypothetical protein
VFAESIKSPRCTKCRETMSLRIIEPARPGFDSQTFECPKCFSTETFVVSISREVEAEPGKRAPSDLSATSCMGLALVQKAKHRPSGV